VINFFWKTKLAYQIKNKKTRSKFERVFKIIKSMYY
jgi:hypothetical protein